MQTSPNDRIRIACIGTGGMGSGDIRSALQIPGVELAAVADIYDGRLIRAKEVWGNHIATTRDYREILDRKDIDAVIIGTPDHWHAKISIDAMNAGKDVYCEKPMVHEVSEGPQVIAAQNKTGRIFVVGSQYVSSLVYLKARDLLQAGAIGELNYVDAWLDRNTAIGAWQYSIPPDASPENIDWNRFLGKAPKRPFEPIRLFRWRNYSDYGTGVAGDLFVHLLSGLHLVTGSLGPTRVYSTGGVRFWKDGRDAPDVVLALLDYSKTDSHPEFTLSLRVNLANGGGEGFGFRFVGSEGVMTTGFTSVEVSRHPRESEPGYSIGTFAKSTQDRFLKDYREKYPPSTASADSLRPNRQERYTPPPGHNMHLEHHRNFFTAVRTRKPFLEDAVFGFRAAAPSLLCNVSLAREAPCGWNPVAMKQV